MSESIKVGVVAIITNDQNEIMLGIRKNCFGAGDYGCPGGHLEFLEDLFPGLLREIKEETDIEANPSDLAFVGLVNQPRPSLNPPLHYIQIGFHLSSSQIPKVMEPDRCEGWKFFPPTNLPPNIFVSHLGLLKLFIAGSTSVANERT